MAKLTWRAGLALGAFLASPAAADQLRDSLEASLSAGDLQQIPKIIHDHQGREDQAEIAQWIREKVADGQGPASFAQSMILLSFREGRKEDALMYLSYYRALIFLDGATCRDRSSPGSLLEGTIFLFGRLVTDPAITVDQKKQAVDRALALEEATASRRRVDPALCGAGLSAYAKDLNIPLPEQPGTAPQATSPQSLNADDPAWRERRASDLPRLRKVLLTLGGVPDTPSPGAGRAR